MQWGQGIVAAGVAGDQVQVGHRYVELGALCIFQGQELGGLAFDFQGGQAQVTSHAVVDMHHWCTFAQFGEVLDDGIVGRLTTFFTTPALHHALAEQWALGDQGQAWVIQQQAVVERAMVMARRSLPVTKSAQPSTV